MSNYVHNYEPALKQGALVQQVEIEGSLGVTWNSGSPTGAKNGINVTFTLPTTPAANSLQLFLNGQFLTDGGTDFTLAGSTITMITPPLATDTFSYKYTS